MRISTGVTTGCCAVHVVYTLMSSEHRGVFCFTAVVYALTQCTTHRIICTGLILFAGSFFRDQSAAAVVTCHS